MTSGWYYAKAGAAEGREVGPLTWDELYHLANAGTVSSEDIVWNPRLPRGVAAGMIPGLFPGRQTPQAPVVQAPPEPLPVPAATQPRPPAPTSPAPPAPPAPLEPPAPTSPAPAAPTEPRRPEMAPATVSEAGEGLADEDVSEGPNKRQKRTTKPKGPKPETQGNRLPALVLLLVVVIAAAGLTAYFIYFRDVDSPDADQQGLTPQSTVVATITDPAAPHGPFAR